MKKVILMALAAASMFFVSCNDDEKSGGEDVRHSFELSASVDTTIVQAGKSVGTTFVLSGMPEDDKVNMSFSLNFLEDDYKGSFVYDGQTFYEGQDLSALFFGGDTLRLDFVTSSAKPADGVIDVVAVANTMYASATDTISVRLKNPYNAELLEETYDDIFLHRVCSIKFRINEDLYNDEDLYRVYVSLASESKEIGMNGNFNCNQERMLKANEELIVPYVPSTVGKHIINIEISNKDGEEYSLFAIVNTKAVFYAKWSSSECTSDGVFSIKSRYGGDAYKSITFSASEEQYTGKFFLSYETDDANIKFIEYSSSGQKTLVANEKYELNSGTKQLNLSAISGSPDKTHIVKVTLSDEIGNEKVFEFKITYLISVSVQNYSQYKDYIDFTGGYYEYNSVVTLFGFEDFNTGKYVSGWNVNGNVFNGNEYSFAVTAKTVVYPIISDYNIKIALGQGESAGSYTSTQWGTYGLNSSITLATTKNTAASGGLDRYWQVNDGDGRWIQLSGYSFNSKNKTITFKLYEDCDTSTKAQLDLKPGVTLYFRYASQNGD